MIRIRTVGCVAPAKPNERSIGHRIGMLRPSLRGTLGFDATRRNRNLPCTNVGWMTLRPSTNVLQAFIHNPNPRWKKRFAVFHGVAFHPTDFR